MNIWLHELNGRMFRVGGLVIGLALITRLPGLVGRPLWYDEAFAVLFSAKGVPAMVQGTLQTQGAVAADVHPLLYYALLGVWQRVFGSGVLSVRSLSLVLGLIVVALGYGLARRSLGVSAGMGAGLWLAISPFQVHYAQEVRMYVLLTALLLAATWAFWEARLGAGAWAWIAFGVLAAAAQYAHTLAAFYLLPLALIPWLEKRWRLGVRTVWAGLLATALYLPWLIYLPSQVARLSWAYWIGRPGGAEVLRTLMTFVADRPVPAWPNWGIAVVLFVALLSFGVLAWHLLRPREAGAGRLAAREYGWLATAPVAFLFAASWVQPVYLDRALLPSAAALALVLGWWVTRRQIPLIQRSTVAAGLAACCVLGLVGFYSYRGFPHAPFEELDQYLQTHLASDEVILHSNKLSALPAVYYAPDLPHHYLADPPGSDSDTLALSTQMVLGWIADSDAAAATRGQAGVWFIQFRQERDDYAELGFAIPPALDWLQRNFESVSSLTLGDLEITHFRLPDAGLPDV
ncbi:MAG: glycosyltransferase family 39 protein [Anaerolineales bacterium]